jgi:uncharacterized membrane protein YgcG
VVTRLRRSALALVGAAALGGVLIGAGRAEPTNATAKSFAIESLSTDALVAADGDMQVTETVRYRFDGGPFTVVIRSFERDLDQIGDMAASDGSGPLEVVPPSESISGQWEALLRGPMSDRTVDITFTYRVDDAVTVGSDVGDLNWKFVGTEHPGIGSMVVAVRFAGTVPPATPESADSDTSVLRGWAHGPTNGTITVETSRIDARVDNVPAGQFVEIRAAVPATAFTIRGTDELLPDILDEELRLIEGIDAAESRRSLGWILTPIAVLVGAIGTGWIWFTGGREPRSREVLGEYWREPLDDPPAVAIATLARGGVAVGPMIAGTLTDLAQRGFLRIRAEHEQRFGPDRTVHHFEWMGKPTDDLEPFERELLEMVFRGRNDADSTELSDWAQANRSTATGMISSMTADVKRLYDDRGYDATGGTQFVPLALLCAAVAVVSLGVATALGNGVGWFGLGAAVGLFGVGATVLRNRSQAGAEAAAKAEGLKRYLKDFSRLSEAPIGHLILWERFLVFAVAFGVSAELVRGLAAKLPQVMSDPNFGLWYVGAAHHFDGFDQLGVQGAAVAQAATPNSSGSGGGFSGGGSSGGGGGGGFGAR